MIFGFCVMRTLVRTLYGALRPILRISQSFHVPYATIHTFTHQVTSYVRHYHFHSEYSNRIEFIVKFSKRKALRLANEHTSIGALLV